MRFVFNKLVFAGLMEVVAVEILWALINLIRCGSNFVSSWNIGVAKNLMTWVRHDYKMEGICLLDNGQSASLNELSNCITFQNW